MTWHRRLPYQARTSSVRVDAGFTLLELAVVVFILALMLSVSLPSFTGLGENRLSSEARRIASVVRYLNDSAIATKETLNLKIDLRERTLRYNSPEGEKSEAFDSISGIELQSRGLVSEGEVTIFFGPLGAQEGFRFHLAGPKQGMLVSFNAMSGRVTIQDKS